jgi:hypothetical protein
MRACMAKSTIRTLVVVYAVVRGFTSPTAVCASGKVDICHFQEKNDSWKLLSVGVPAVGAHLENHDDAVPGETTSQTGTVLDADCIPVTSCDIPGGSCIVFITSETSSGNIGGLASADSWCQKLAESAGLAGTYKAWLSDSTTDARERITNASVPYTLVDGITVVANDFSDLTDGEIAHEIDQQENGVAISRSTVWTGTSFDGLVVSVPICASCACRDWRWGEPGDRGGAGAVFDGVNTDARWTQAETRTCETPARIYCFEQ